MESNNVKKQEMLYRFDYHENYELMNEHMFCDECWGLLPRFSCADLKRVEVRNQSNYKKKQSRLLVTCRYCQFMLRHTRIDRHVQHTCRRNMTYNDLRLCKCKKLCSDCGIKHYQKNYVTKPLNYEYHRKTYYNNPHIYF